MNRTEAYNLVLANTGRSDKSSLILDSLNLAVKKVSSERLWSDLLTEGTATLTVDDPTVALGSSVKRLIEVRLMDGQSSYPIPIRQKSWVTDHYPDIASMSSARPCLGYLEGTNLVLVPPPDQEYSGLAFSYYRIHPTLDTASDEILIGLADTAVVSYATYWIFKSLQQWQEANQWYQEYQVQIADAKRVDSQNTAVKFIAEPRPNMAEPLGAYWLDPFVQHVPGTE